MTGVRRMNNAIIVPLDLIEPHPANVREQLGDLTELTESIRTKGILQAVVVRDRGDMFQLITGHRRCAAARLAGRTEVPAIVRGETSDADVIESMLIENMHRRRLNPIEEANAFQALILRGRTQVQVANAVGVSPMTVNKRVALLELSEVEQRALVNKSLGIEEAYDLAHQRRWERGERRGQAKGNSKGKEARPRWVPHFNADHPLADHARGHCRRTHDAPRSTKLSDVACGECWEAVIRLSASGGELGEQLSHSVRRTRRNLASAALTEPQLVPDLSERRAVKQASDDVAVIGRKLADQ